MIKVTALYSFENHKERVTLEFEDGTLQEQINTEVCDDYWEWAQQFNYGWHIESIERIEQ